MAEEDDWTDEEEKDVNLGPQEAGAAFRAEMWATDFFLGNWMYIVGVLVITLITVFVYGQYVGYARQQQLLAARQVAEVEIKLPGSVAELSAMLASGQDVDKDLASQQAAALEAISTSGAAKAEALVKAAELYRIAEKPDEQRRALEAVVSTGIAPMAPLAEVALANLDLEAGNAEAATGRLATVAQRADYFGEQAALDLGIMYEHLGDNDKAMSTYDDFINRFPESPRLEMVKKRRESLGAG